MDNLYKDLIKDNQLRFLEYLLYREEKPANVLSQLLEYALFYFSHEIIESLLDRGAELEEGSIALIRAVDNDQYNILKMYFSHRPLSREDYAEELDNLQSEHTYCLTEYAAIDASLETLQVLIEAECPFTHSSLLLRAAQGNNVEIAKFALTELVRQNAEDVISEAFEIGCERKNIEVVELIASTVEDEAMKERVKNLKNFTEILELMSDFTTEVDETQKVSPELLNKLQSLLKTFE